MRTLAEISDMLAQHVVQSSYGKLKLAEDAGVTYRTLQHVLSGTQDYKVSTLMAVADRLGLELVVVPKEAARGMTGTRPQPEVRSRVQAALDRLKGEKP
jgi:transcriptional regulator with XRE-family HTH domain